MLKLIILIFMIITIIGQVFGAYVLYTDYHSLGLSILMGAGAMSAIEVLFLRNNL